MGIWGVEGSIDDHIRHLGLRCYGGNSSNKYGMTYHVFNEDKSFDVQLTMEQWKDVENIYKEWKIKNRKDKLIRIEKSNL